MSCSRLRDSERSYLNLTSILRVPSNTGVVFYFTGYVRQRLLFFPCVWSCQLLCCADFLRPVRRDRDQAGLGKAPLLRRRLIYWSLLIEFHRCRFSLSLYRIRRFLVSCLAICEGTILLLLILTLLFRHLCHWRH